MIRRQPRSTQGVSSAASDVYKRQEQDSDRLNLMSKLQDLRKELRQTQETLVKEKDIRSSTGFKLYNLLEASKLEIVNKEKLIEEHQSKYQTLFVEYEALKEILRSTKEEMKINNENMAMSREEMSMMRFQHESYKNIILERTNEIAELKPVSYTHLRAHETSLHLVCRLLLEKKKKINTKYNTAHQQCQCR
eukprot:TRINITY_DN6342_c0_g1_i4.p1 TRINITY_DN6342_c0_g1~~TRINITY_DN6342_c0_g1_i4.p1  ORF type:complete len:192 (-),score=53.38 TRINITY_DN6342_c0_g1_i4:54-629(-)